MSDPFREASRLEPIAPGRHRARLDASWGQGQALFGGIQAALLTAGCEALVDDPERHLRTLAVAFCKGATPGDFEVQATVERGGRYMSHLSARLVQGGETVATALAVYARDREDPLELAGAEPPPLLPPEAIEPIPRAGVYPVFTHHFDVRFTPGLAPYSQGERAEVSGWVRFREPTPLDAPAVATLLDVWPPSVLTLLAPPRASASVDLRYDLLQPLPLRDVAEDDFLAFRCRVLHWTAGHGIDEGELWTRDGRPVARIRQLRVIF